MHERNRSNTPRMLDMMHEEREALLAAVDKLIKPETKIGLGDVVSLGWSDGYDTATVSQVYPDGTVDLFRPYTHTADFSHTGGVICYVGIETVSRVNPERLKLLRKSSPLK